MLARRHTTDAAGPNVFCLVCLPQPASDFRWRWRCHRPQKKPGFYPGSRFDDKPRCAGFAPPSAGDPPGGKARKSVAFGAAKPQPAPDFRWRWRCHRPQKSRGSTPAPDLMTNPAARDLRRHRRATRRAERHENPSRSARPSRSLLLIFAGAGVATAHKKAGILPRLFYI